MKNKLLYSAIYLITSNIVFIAALINSKHQKNQVTTFFVLVTINYIISLITTVYYRIKYYQENN